MTDLKPCPFCGVKLVANTNQADFYVARYGTHWDHPPGLCFLADHEVSPSNIEDWNTRAILEEQAPAEPVASVVSGALLGHHKDVALLMVPLPIGTPLYAAPSKGST